MLGSMNLFFADHYSSHPLLRTNSRAAAAKPFALHLLAPRPNSRDFHESEIRLQPRLAMLQSSRCPS